MINIQLHIYNTVFHTFLILKTVSPRMEMPMLALRKTKMYCWATELGKKPKRCTVYCRTPITLRGTVVSTNKRSQAEVFKVYSHYSICNAIMTMYTLHSLHYVQLMSAGVYLHSHSTGQPELSSPY